MTLVDLVQQLGITEPLEVDSRRQLSISSYAESYADTFAHWYSIDNATHLGKFVTKGWSPSIVKLKQTYGDSYIDSAEYLDARNKRHEKTVEQNSSNRFFFVMLEKNNPVGYLSAVINFEDEVTYGRLSTMLGYAKYANKGIVSTLFPKVLCILADTNKFTYFDSKVVPGNKASIILMEKIGLEAKGLRNFSVNYRDLQGNSQEKTVPRHYFYALAQKFKTI